MPRAFDRGSIPRFAKRSIGISSARQGQPLDLSMAGGYAAMRCAEGAPRPERRPAMEPPSADSELLNHFSVLVYPFLHDISDRNRYSRFHALETLWAPWWSRLNDQDLAATLESTTFFLPYIRGLLFPETQFLQQEPQGEHYNLWAGLVRRWSSRGLERFCNHLPASAIVRLTGTERLRRELGEFSLVQRRESSGRATEVREVPASMDWVDCLLFPSGIGFLLLKVRLRTPQAGLGQLIALNGGLRLVHPPTFSWTLPVLRLQETGAELRIADVINCLTRGLVGQLERGEDEGQFFRPRGADSRTRTAYTETEPGYAYGERCELLSYACIHLTEAERRELPAGPFRKVTDRLLYEFATCTGLGESVRNPIWVPSRQQANRVRRLNRLAMWRCWTAMALKESLVFLGTEDLTFNRRSLPYNIENNYLPLYLYTLYQKFQLLVYSNDLMREVAQVGGGLRGARALLQRFVAFRNQYWFNEVTRKPMGGDLYRTLQQGLEVNGLYQMVTSSVKEAKEFYEEVWNRQLQRAKDVLAYLGPATVALGAVRVFLDGPEFYWTAGTLVTLVLVFLLVYWLRMRRRRRRRAARTLLGTTGGTTWLSRMASLRLPWSKDRMSK
jgi:hypothetical protein